MKSGTESHCGGNEFFNGLLGMNADHKRQPEREGSRPRRGLICFEKRYAPSPVVSINSVNSDGDEDASTSAQ